MVVAVVVAVAVTAAAAVAVAAAAAGAAVTKRPKHPVVGFEGDPADWRLGLPLLCPVIVSVAMPVPGWKAGQDFTGTVRFADLAGMPWKVFAKREIVVAVPGVRGCGSERVFYGRSHHS